MNKDFPGRCLTCAAATMQEAGTIQPYFAPEGIHGGALLGVRGTEHISFYDWASLRCVRRIDGATEAVYWNQAGDMLALVAPTSFYILRYNRDAVAAALAAGGELDEDGVEDAFEVVTEVRKILKIFFLCTARRCERRCTMPSIDATTLY